LTQFVLALIIALVANACGGDSGGGNPNDPSQVNIQFSTVELVTGTGATAAAAGNTANVRYTLWLYNPAGTDNKGVQRDAGTFSFRLGSGGVIPGFDQGVNGMRVGGKRRINVPSNLAYGAQPPQGSGIPVNAALVFEVELQSLTQ